MNFFKLGRYQKAVAYARAGVAKAENIMVEKYGSISHLEKEDAEPFLRNNSRSLKTTLNDYKYVLAQCLRKVKKFEEAGQLYLEISSFYEYNERYALI